MQRPEVGAGEQTYLLLQAEFLHDASVCGCDARADLRRLRHLRGLADEHRRARPRSTACRRQFADAWRDQYQPQLETVRDGSRPWVNLDVLHRIGLDVVLARPRARPARARTARELTTAWHRLEAVARRGRRPDGSQGRPHHRPVLERPHRAVREPREARRAAVGRDPRRRDRPRLQARPEGLPSCSARSVSSRRDVCMVAAHNGDLLAAAGARPAHRVRHPGDEEHGPGQATDLAPEGEFDVVTTASSPLADRL